MKIKSMMLIAFSLFCSTKIYSQIAFGVSPGLTFNSSYVGYRIGERVVPYVGLQYAGAKLSSESSQSITQRSNGVQYSDEYSSEGEASVKLFMPSIGAKFFVAEKNKLKAFANICLSKPIIKAKTEVDGETNDELTDRIDAIKLWGGEFGAGAEYFFDDNFSIGGEFGVRYIHLKQEYSDEEKDSGMFSSYSHQYSNKLSLNVMPTYSKIALNFYF